MAPPKFQHSFALFDAEGRLVDWDAGYAEEWRLNRFVLRAGITYEALLTAALENPESRRFIVANYPSLEPADVIRDQIAGFGVDRVREYRSTKGRIISVEELRTISGGVRRLARDITDEKKTNRALAEARQRLEAADSDNDGVLVETRRTADGGYLFPKISEGLRRLLDLPADVVGGDPMIIYSRMIRSDEDNVRQAELLDRSTRTLEICSMEYRIRDGKDRIRWIRQSMMPRREADGSTVFSGVMRDITREKEAEDQVEMLRSVVVRSTDSIAIFESGSLQDRKSRIVYVNSRFVELFGGSEDDLVGKPIEYLQSSQLDDDAAEVMTRALLRDDGEPVEIETRGKDGRIFWMEVRVSTIQRFENGAFRWVVISRDISERRHIQQELLRAKDAAEAGNRAKSNFLANMSHELRTPLNAIIGFTELIETGIARTGWQPSYAEYLADVNHSGHHLLELINTVLDLSKIEAGSLELTIEPVDLRHLIETSLTVISGLARGGGITLTSSLPAEGATIPGDFLKLKQVLLNVLSNAIKFTPSGGQISTTVTMTADRAVIAIDDTGCGISEDDLRRVTKPFEQAEGTLARKFTGSGLGLAIARELCGLHGGELTIASIEGRGTTVRITLPR